MQYTTLGKPQMPPPEIPPLYCSNHDMVSDQVLVQYINRYLYIWLFGGEDFWFFPTRLDGNHLYGYTWTGSDWQYDRLTWRQIDSIF